MQNLEKITLTYDLVIVLRLKKSATCHPVLISLSVAWRSKVWEVSQSSDNVDQQRGTQAWGWAHKNKWAEHVVSSEGVIMHCLYPGCKQKYETKSRHQQSLDKSSSRHSRQWYKQWKTLQPTKSL